MKRHVKLADLTPEELRALVNKVKRARQFVCECGHLSSEHIRGGFCMGDPKDEDAARDEDGGFIQLCNCEFVR